MWKRWGKLGEGSSRVRREARKINGSRLGEMGEISTGDLAGRPGCRNQDLHMQLPAPADGPDRRRPVTWLPEARLSEQQRKNARMVKDRGVGEKKSRYFPRVRAAEAAATGALCGLPAGGRGRRAWEDPRTGVRSSGCGRRQEGAKKAPEGGSVVAGCGCVV